jgi:hypothetical protein
LLELRVLLVFLLFNLGQCLLDDPIHVDILLPSMLRSGFLFGHLPDRRLIFRILKVFNDFDELILGEIVGLYMSNDMIETVIHPPVAAL